MGHDVFISYSAKDQKIVEGLSAYLEQNGIRCWIAYRDIPAGKNWADYIPPAIKTCKLMVYVHSSIAAVSYEIDKEIALCLKYQHPIIPFRIQNVDYSNSKAFHLTTINHIDAFPKPEKYFGVLLTKIQNLFPELKRNKVIEERKPDKDVEREAHKISKETVGLMLLLSKIGLWTIPLGFGLLGGLYGVFHSVVAIKKNITEATKTKTITLLGLVFFSFLSLIAAISILFSESEDLSNLYWCSFGFIVVLGIIYPIIWKKKLKRFAKNNGYNTKELQKESFAKHKKKIITLIVGIIVAFCAVIGLALCDILDEDGAEGNDIGVVDENALQKGEWQKEILRLMENRPFHEDKSRYNGETRIEYAKALGVYLFKNSDSYWGEWLGFKYDGEGLYIANGSDEVANCPGCKYFVGNYVSGKKVGKGTCYNDLGEMIYHGDFKDGKPLEVCPQSYENKAYKFEYIEYPENNMRYVGETKDGEQFGVGILFRLLDGVAYFSRTWGVEGSALNDLIIRADGSFEVVKDE